MIFKEGDKVRIKKSSGVLCFDSCTKINNCPAKGCSANNAFTVSDKPELHRTEEDGRSCGLNYLEKNGQVTNCWFYDEWLEPAMKWIRMK